MKRIKGFIIMLLVMASVFSQGIAVSAADDDENDTSLSVISEQVITDQDELQRIQAEDPEYIPEGYHIDEIRYITFVLDDLGDKDNVDFSDEIQLQLFDTWTVKNVIKASSEYYFPDSPISSDWVDGPSSYTHTYKEKVSAKYSTNVSVKADIVTAGVGFDVTKESEFEKSYQASVPSGKKMNLKVYGNYEKYTFNIYKNGNRQGAGTAYKPIGLTFKQTLYSK